MAIKRENKFLPGLKGTIVTKYQRELEELLYGDMKTTITTMTTGFFPTFYFPVDIKTEVCIIFGFDVLTLSFHYKSMPFLDLFCTFSFSL